MAWNERTKRKQIDKNRSEPIGRGQKPLRKTSQIKCQCKRNGPTGQAIRSHLQIVRVYHLAYGFMLLFRLKWSSHIDKMPNGNGPSEIHPLPLTTLGFYSNDNLSNQPALPIQTHIHTKTHTRTARYPTQICLFASLSLTFVALLDKWLAERQANKRKNVFIDD